MKDLVIRPATPEDIPAIVAMLAADSVAAGRESADDLTPYYAAWERIAADPNQHPTVAVLVQLTSDRSRTDAHRFYERLGFTGSHVGFKLQL